MGWKDDVIYILIFTQQGHRGAMSKLNHIIFSTCLHAFGANVIVCLILTVIQRLDKVDLTSFSHPADHSVSI